MKKRHIATVGIFGTVLAALCCAGTPVLLAFLASMGLGFVVKDFILLPALMFFLILTAYGLSASKNRQAEQEINNTNTANNKGETQ